MLKDDAQIEDVDKQITQIKKTKDGIILPKPKPIIVTKVKPPKKSKFYSEKDVVRAKRAIKLNGAVKVV